MLLRTKRGGAIHSLSAFFVAAITITGCTSSQINTDRVSKVSRLKQSATPSIHNPQLRIFNQGLTTLKELTIIFPKDKRLSDEILFGDIVAGATTAYMSVPYGVYRYAAYSLVVNGKKVIVPVMDFVGERPMSGNAFTYTVRFTPKRGRIVELVKVTKDK